MTAQTELEPLAYTVPMAARKLSLSERQVRRMCAKGEIEAKLLGGRILIPTEVLTALLAEAPSAAL